MSAHPLNKECAYCVKHANDCNGRAACLRCFAEVPRVGYLASADNVGCAYELWQARTPEDVEREYQDACVALANTSNVAELAWEFLKANPDASTAYAEERALQFITWRTSFVEAAEARVLRLHAERKAMSK